jgi:hypothetical protein
MNDLKDSKVIERWQISNIGCSPGWGFFANI